MGVLKKLLFLDFDGVLHPTLCDPSAYFSETSRLLASVEGFEAGLGIVISSSWRFHCTTDEIMRLLCPALGKLIVGSTPNVSPGKHQRYREIVAFLEMQGKSPDWRALDDSAFEFPTVCPQLILCNGRTGIDDPVITEIRTWLDTP